MRSTTFAILLAALVPSAASAHTLMTSPTPRSNSDGLKTGPCGNVAPTGTPTELTAGQTLVVDWLETVDHPGYYRIAFSLDGDQGFDTNVLADNITDIQCTAPPCNYTAQVTIPDQSCENCSLQLIQYMGTAPPYSMYYSCADITIVGGQDPTDPPTDPPDENNPDEPGSDAGVGTTDDSDSDPDEVSGGCSTSNGSSSATHIALLIFALVFASRRRH